MYRPDRAIPVKVRPNGRRTTTIKANVRDECNRVLSITTTNDEGFWTPIILGDDVTILGRSPAMADNIGLAQDFLFVVDPVGVAKPLTLVGSARDLCRVARTYGQEPDELFEKLAELAADRLT